MNILSNIKKVHPNARLIKIYKTNDKSLSRKSVWVWSAMMKRFRRSPVSQRRISAYCGIERTKTLPKVLQELIQAGLVIKSGKKYQAVYGDAKRFFTTKSIKGKILLCYNWAIYEKGRDILDGLVEAADAIKWRRASILANWFSCHRVTISAVRKRLKAKNNPEIPPDRDERIPQNTIVNNEPIEIEQTSKKEGEEMVVVVNNYFTMEASKNDLVESLMVQHGFNSDLVRNGFNQVCQIASGLAAREKRHILSQICGKCSDEDGMEDYLGVKIPQWKKQFFTGISSVEQILEKL